MRAPTREQLEQFRDIFIRVAHRRGWNEAEKLVVLKALHQRGFAAPPPVEGGSPNFVQVSGPQGRTQTLAASSAPNTFIWNPQSLKGQDAGGDFMYARRIKFRNVIQLTNSTTGAEAPPTQEQVAQALGNVRVFSQFLGEMVPKNLNSVPILYNHDQYFANGFRPITRRRPTPGSLSGGGVFYYEFIFEVPLERDYLMRSLDTCPWLPFFEGAIFEVDIAPSTSLANIGWTVGNVTQTCTIDYYVDKQALIHSPMQQRLYRVVSGGPEYILKSVGSPNGLDGVVSGSRLACMSWLSAGLSTITGSATGNFHDNGFYAAFGGASSSGPNFGTNGLTRLDVPFRGQVSVDDISAWLEAFLSDCNPIRMFTSLVQLSTNTGDITQWPFVDSPTNTQALAFTNAGAPNTSLISDGLDFFPMIWPSPGDRISDFQKVNGDLSFTASQPSPPGSAILNLFRTDEVCGFTPDKVMDLMDRMGLPHKQRGGSHLYVPKYAGAKKADDTTIWGFPLKIIKA